MSTMRFLLPLVLALATCWAQDPILQNVGPFDFENVQEKDISKYKLPVDIEGVKPINYEILLRPYFDDAPKGKNDFSFDGRVNITLEITQMTETITLHAKQLDNIEAKLQCILLTSKTQELEPPKIFKAEVTQSPDLQKADFIELNFNENIFLTTRDRKYAYFLIITYNGTLEQTDLRGFYKSSYKNNKDQDVWLATTQFEPTAARRAFPCWDEPEIKATFDIIIIHPSDYDAISNMKQEEKKKMTQDKIEATQFKKTPKMSTYLVAFVVAKYDHKGKNKRDDTFSVWTKPDSIDNVEFALEYGQKVLEELETYTGIKYYEPKKNEPSMNMPKMDQISIPDFGAGAMENWGLVTYRESSLLYIDNVTTTREKQDIVAVISHEFAHQWFGNLVTPKWWKYIWLNEGFATFLQYVITDNVIDDDNWRLMDQFVVKTLQESAFVSDASHMTHPMNMEVVTPSQIQKLFDDITYKKAGSVIRMMQHFLSNEIFEAGLKTYLEKYQYQSVTSDDLFEAMQTVYEEAKKAPKLPFTITDIMNSWVNKAGYPVLTVERDYDKNNAKLRQERFFSTGPLETEEYWYIPINFVKKSSPNFEDTTADYWLTENDDVLPTKNLNTPKEDWVIFNNLQTGYYRVNYDKTNWDLLAKHLQSDRYGEIGPVTRAQLIDDALNLASARYLEYSTALPITLYLDKEVDYIPWYAAIRAYDHLDRMLQNMSNYETFQKYVAQQLNKYVETLELKDDPKNTTHMFQIGREMVLNTACKYEHASCKNYAEERLKTWLEDQKKKMPTDLRNGIFCAGLRHAEQGIWNTTLQAYKNSTDSNERQAILKGLGCAQNAEVVGTFLRLTLKDESIVSFFDALNVLTDNSKSFDIIVDFILENYDKIIDKEDGKSKLIDCIEKLANTVNNNSQYGKLTHLVMKHEARIFSPNNVFDKNMKFALLKGKQNLDWIGKHQNEISEWFEKNFKENKPQGNSATSISVMSFLVLIPILISRLY